MSVTQGPAAPIIMQNFFDLRGLVAFINSQSGQFMWNTLKTFEGDISRAALAEAEDALDAVPCESVP